MCLVNLLLLLLLLLLLIFLLTGVIDFAVIAELVEAAAVAAALGVNFSRFNLAL